MFADPAAPTVKLVWYFTDQPFQRFPSAFNSLDWDEEPWRPRVLGEVYGASRTYNGRQSIPGIIPGHQCGDAVYFLQGSPWPYDGPIREYDDDGIPTCCQRNLVAFISSAARPASLVAHHRDFQSSISTAGRPSSIMELTAAEHAEVGTSARPGSLVVFTEAEHAEVGTGSRPGSLTIYFPFELSAVGTGARPASSITLTAAERSNAATSSRPASSITLTAAERSNAATSSRPAANVYLFAVERSNVATSSRPDSTYTLTATEPVAIASAARPASIVAVTHTGCIPGTVTVAQWTFETSMPSGSGNTIGPITPEAGAGSLNGFHASPATAWSSPTGNGSPHSLSANNWSGGDRITVQVNLSAFALYHSADFRIDATRSATMPDLFSIDYSTNGTTWTNLTNVSLPPAGWNPVSPGPLITTVPITSLLGQATVFLRFVCLMPAPGGATCRVDNLTVTATC